VILSLKVHEDGVTSLYKITAKSLILRERTHDVTEDERFVEVWVSVSVGDDVGLDRSVSDGDFNTRRFDA